MKTINAVFMRYHYTLIRMYIIKNTGHKEELNKWKDRSPQQIRTFNIVMMSLFPNLIHRFSAIPVRIPASYFIDINKPILKFIQRSNRPRINNIILKKTMSEDRLYLISRLNIKFSNQDSVVLVKEQTEKSVEQNRQTRNGPP